MMFNFIARAQEAITIQEPPTGIKDISKLLSGLIQVAMIIAAILTFAFLVWGGIQWITSGGNQEAAKGAKEKITDAIFGLAFLAAVWVIWRLIVYFLGITPTASGPFNLKLPQP